MTPEQILARLAAPNVRPRTYLRAWYMPIAANVIRGKCCKNPICEFSKASTLVDWLERSAWARAGEA